MLAMGAGGLDVAAAMAGVPFSLPCPKVLGVRLVGELSPWVGAKDVILELLRRLTVKGGVGLVLEYFGPGVETLNLYQRTAITNMGAELGATGSIFPSDEQTRRFLAEQGREEAWQPLAADPDCDDYDRVEEIDLSALEPLVACPSSPDAVRPAAQLTDVPVEQVIIGSCGGGSYWDLMILAAALKDKHPAPGVSLAVNPGSRQALAQIAANGTLGDLLEAGVRLHQAGCLGCIGMSQAPATGTASVRTFPRNFPGRSGTKGDQVYLCGPQVAAATALAGHIADPRELGPAPVVPPPRRCVPTPWPRRRPTVPAWRCCAAPTSPLPPVGGVDRGSELHRDPQGGRQHHHRSHHAGGQPDPAPALQRAGHQPLRVRGGG